MMPHTPSASLRVHSEQDGRSQTGQWVVLTRPVPEPKNEPFYNIFQINQI